jgi:hypothetical protein
MKTQSRPEGQKKNKPVIDTDVIVPKMVHEIHDFCIVHYTDKRKIIIALDLIRCSLFEDVVREKLR